MLTKPEKMLATITPKLASHCIGEKVEAGRNLWVESDDTSWPYFKVTTEAMLGKRHLCHPAENVLGGIQVDLSILSAMDPVDNVDSL